MREVFEAIDTAINMNVAAIRWVDMDLGQLEQTPPPVSWDCALIGFSSASFGQIAGDSQQGELVVTIRLGFKLLERTHSKANAVYRSQALGHLDTVAAVHAAVQGLSGPNFTGMNRIAYANEKRADYRVIEMTYTCLFTDEKTSPYVDWDTASEGAELDFCIQPDIEP